MLLRVITLVTQYSQYDNFRSSLLYVLSGCMLYSQIFSSRYSIKYYVIFEGKNSSEHVRKEMVGKRCRFCDVGNVMRCKILLKIPSVDRSRGFFLEKRERQYAAQKIRKYTPNCYNELSILVGAAISLLHTHIHLECITKHIG